MSVELKIDSVVKFNNGLSIPQFGLGSWRSDKGKVESIVKLAILNGYRHIDCAWIYNNEEEVGNGIMAALNESNGNISRKDLFLTSKLWNTKHEPTRARKSLKETLTYLKTDYLDLLLIHWPIAWDENKNSDTKQQEFDKVTTVKDTWQEMEKFVNEGLVKSIGVSNFNIEQIDEILSFAKIKPVNNQVECHPYFNQLQLREYLNKHNILLTSYCPLGNLGRPVGDVNHGVSPLNDPIILSLSVKHKKSAAQILIRWHLQSGLIVIPKTVTPDRLIENSKVFDFNLSAQEMEDINKLGHKNLRFVNPDFLPNGATIFPTK